MLAQELLHQQRALAPKEDLARFAGQWVVLRDGVVVAHAPGMKELISRRQLGDRDSVLRVSNHSGSFAF
jgi:hypothetical protein